MGVEDLAKKLGYEPGDAPSHLRQALKSAHSGRSRNESNPRLAWLGDAVVDLVVSKRAFLSHANPTLEMLHHEHEQFVPKIALSEAAIAMKLHEHLEPTLGEAEARAQHETMEAAFEAIAAALYLDRDFSAAERFVDGALPQSPPPP